MKVMKKILFAILISVLFILTACSTSNDANKEVIKEKPDGKKTEETGGTLEVDKGLLSVEITIPSTLMEGEDIDNVVAEAKKDGIKDVTKNEDGSVTYKMSKAQHKKMMKEMKTNVTTYVDEIVNDEDFASIQDIKHNGSFSEFTVVVDKAAFENSFDGFATLGLGMSGMYYQAFDGTSGDKLNVTVYTKDASTGEVFSTVVYPDALEEME
jgi:hypothetical protein